MDEKKPLKEGRGNVRYLWVLVGAYLLYLAWNQLQLFLQGEVTKTGDILICVVSGVVFAAVGAWVIYREWRAWRYAQAHKDDPETWGEASEEDNASADDDAPESEEDGGADALELAAPESDEAESAEESGDNGGEGAETEVEESGGEEPDDESDDDDEKPDAGKA